MVSKLISWVAVLGMLASSVQAFAAEMGSPEDLASLMQKQGIRKLIVLDQRKDLEGMVPDAWVRGTRLGEDCQTSAISEVHIMMSTYEWIAGYEAYVECEDSPSPAVGLYFDVNQHFLAALALGD
jgi:hypothetical protein